MDESTEKINSITNKPPRDFSPVVSGCYKPKQTQEEVNAWSDRSTLPPCSGQKLSRKSSKHTLETFFSSVFGNHGISQLPPIKKHYNTSYGVVPQFRSRNPSLPKTAVLLRWLSYLLVARRGFRDLRRHLYVRIFRPVLLLTRIQKKRKTEAEEGKVYLLPRSRQLLEDQASLACVAEKP